MNGSRRDARTGWPGVPLAFVLVLTFGNARSAAPTDAVSATIIPDKAQITEGDTLVVRFQICNKQTVPICVCTWPGLAVSAGWDESDGTRSGVIRGYPDSRVLGLEFFRFIDPGKCYEDRVVVNDLFAPPSGIVTLRGEFRSDQTGSQHGLTCWRGRIWSDAVDIAVGKKDTQRDRR